MSKPTDAPSGAPDRDPVQEVRAHLEQALAALDRLHEVLPNELHAHSRRGMG